MQRFHSFWKEFIVLCTVFTVGSLVLVVFFLLCMSFLDLYALLQDPVRRFGPDFFVRGVLPLAAVLGGYALAFFLSGVFLKQVLTHAQFSAYWKIRKFLCAGVFGFLLGAAVVVAAAQVLKSIPVKYIKQNNVGKVREAIQKGAHVNWQMGSLRWTALMYAARFDARDVVRLLVQEGANIEAKNASGRTAFMEAVTFGNIELANILIEYGADYRCARRTEVLQNQGTVITFVPCEQPR